MNSAASEPALIGIDWGTSSLRAFLMNAEGEVLDSQSLPLGILHVEDGNFETAFLDLVANWKTSADIPVIASGMITSRDGWVETPYLPVPAGARELSEALMCHTLSDGSQIHFITGMTTRHGNAPDVMRGEETQIIGASALGMGDGAFVLPGTHSKWLTVADERIADYATYMTGEVFSALRGHTILGKLMEPGPFHEKGFRLGLEAGLADGARLLHQLFLVRTLPLFGNISHNMTEDYLSGLLIGTEISSVDLVANSGPITIVGRDDLSDRYAIALEAAGVNSRRAGADIVASGHFLIAKNAGLLA